MAQPAAQQERIIFNRASHKQKNNSLNRIQYMKERVMMIKYTSGENHLCMEARVSFPEEVTIH